MSVINYVEEQKSTLIALEKVFAAYEEMPRAEKTRGYVEGLLEELQLMSSKVKERHEELNDHVRETSLRTEDIPYFKEDFFFKFQMTFLRFKGILIDFLNELETPTPPVTPAPPVTQAPPVIPAPPSPPFNPTVNSSPNTSITYKVRLPEVGLPTFSGDYFTWIPFRDMFLSLIHNNRELSNIQKFYYLKSACAGTPLMLINDYSTSETSYQDAWAALDNRYNNKRKIVENIFNKFSSLPKSNGSFESIKTLLDTARHTRSQLAKLEVTIQDGDQLFVYTIINKLDLQTYKDWERSLRGSVEIPTVTQLFNFLETTFRMLESTEFARNEPNKSQNSSFKTARYKNQHSVNTTTTNADESCPCCSKRHLLYKCFKFSSLNSSEKHKFLREKGICRNCLKGKHFAVNCKLKARCQLCQEPHHTSIHGIFSEKTSTTPSLNTSSTNASEAKAASNTCNILNSCSAAQVLLATSRVKVGNLTLRALLDPGSQATLITERTVQALRLPKHNTCTIINGVGGEASYAARKLVSLTLRSDYDSLFALDCNALVMPKLTLYSPQPINRNILPCLEDYNLADPHFDRNDPIDLLIGADVYGDIILPELRKFPDSILLQMTHFGWVISGPVAKQSFNQIVNINICTLEEQIKAFWEQEELLEKKPLTLEESACENYFLKTTIRENDGRYCVGLPFKSFIYDKPLPRFAFTDYNALKRLKTIEYKFNSNPNFAAMYTDFMKEYESLGHMVKVGTYPRDLEKNCYFLPHHGVLRESSTTTKLRVVFDGSSKSSACNSLNEELSIGPALQNDLPAIITRWRRFKVGFRSDLEKMFRQIKVFPDHQKFQLILWRDRPDKEINIFKLTTVTYGTACAPYLSIKVLHQLARDENLRFPDACNILVQDSYVDDVISGADSEEEAIKFQKQLCELLAAGQFNLRKWISNSKRFMEAIPIEYRETSEYSLFAEENTVKTLGLEWNILDDQFSFKLSEPQFHRVTKSGLLSEASRLYDPLGWLAPTTIKAKIIFQDLWRLKLDWQDILPDEIQIQWKRYRQGLSALQEIRIPRWLGGRHNDKIELHGFSDASSAAFAAVIYARMEKGPDTFTVKLLQSKTKVAPLKRVTIPRLELNGAVLLAKLMEKIIKNSNFCLSSVIYWTDSTTVLGWIQNESTQLSVYVGNRVAEIQRLSSISQWRYISTNDNPADCASRGVSGAELKAHPLWWEGPTWLSFSIENWPAQPDLNIKTTLELRKSAISTNALIIKDKTYSLFLTSFSSLNRTIRLTAYALRFLSNSFFKTTYTGHLKTYELQKAHDKLVLLAQIVDFSDEIQHLKLKHRLSHRSSLIKLNPFMDKIGILRVGGRLQNADIDFNKKHPIVLAKNNPLSILIFEDAHQKTLHGGLQLMQSYVVRKYWIISSRNLAKRVLRRCSTCFRYTAQAAQQIMGNLPAVRLRPNRAFSNSGVDYAGPILIKQSTLRQAKTTKGYICVFVCMVTKALHLEAVTNLTSEAFLLAFKRFVARRGHCSHLYSDCGTNFVGANKDLQILYNKCKSSLPETLLEKLANMQTEWHFIPPASPHFGGLWEAGVKSIKLHLCRVMKGRLLTFEELTTLLAEIESCLNSRPLSPLSADPEDCNALTPAHFLIGEASTCVPDENLLDCNIDQLKRWRAVELLKQQFWNRWLSEYLSRLQARPKWCNVERDAKPGDLVLLIDQRSTPGQWPLGRVKQIHAGVDGHVRVVTVFCNGKEYKRPITKISFLPELEYRSELMQTEHVPDSNNSHH